MSILSKNTPMSLPTTSEVISMVLDHDEESLKSLFVIDNNSKIQPLRRLVSDVLASQKIVGEDFWCFISMLMSIDRRVYRKPIADVVAKYPSVDGLTCSEDTFDDIVKLMLADTDKLVAGLEFLVPFADMIRPIHHQLLIDCANSVSKPDAFEALFLLLGKTTEDRVALACKIGTPPSLYALYLTLAHAEEKYGVWHIHGLSTLNDSLNALPNNYGATLIKKVILKEVFHEDGFDDDMEVEVVLRGGYEAYFGLIARKNSKDTYKKRIRNLRDYIGQELEFKVISIYKHHLFLQATGSFGFIALMPLIASNKRVKIRDVITAKVVSVINGTKMVLVSQKLLPKKKLESINVLDIGDELEAKFSLYNEKLSAELLGYKQVRANIVSFPHNFDYKKHHRVKVVASRLANCDISVIE